MLTKLNRSSIGTEPHRKKRTHTHKDTKTSNILFWNYFVVCISTYGVHLTVNISIMHTFLSPKGTCTGNLIYDRKQRQSNVLCQFYGKTWLPFAHLDLLYISMDSGG